ncbi:MAG: TonB-dependent receptor [Gemmatimonadaceae bacterium]
MAAGKRLLALHAHRYAVALCSVVAFVRGLGAQASGEVNGRVVSRAGEPIADATVLVRQHSRGAITDQDGRYRIGGLSAGTVTIVTQRVGFRAESTTVLLTRGKVERGDFVLSEAVTVIAPVVITATRELQGRSDGSTTIDVLSGADVRATRASHPAGIMNRLAGVHVSAMSGEAHALAMRQPISTRPVYLYLEDGVPTRATGFFNPNALYEVNLPQAGGIEVIKGPGTALYGSDAIGGIVNVLTRPAPLSPSLESSVEAGAFGYRRLLVTGGATHGQHGVRGDLNLTHSDNWQDGAPSDRQSGSMRWDAIFGRGGWTARTFITGSRIDQRDVPGLSRALFDTAYTINLAPIAYRHLRALRLSSAIERDAGNSTWSVTPFARLDELALLPPWQLSYDPQTWDTRNKSVGVLVKYRRDFAPGQARFIVGVDADVSPGSFVADRVVTTRSGQARTWSSYSIGETQYDYDVTYRSASPYIHAEISPGERLRLDVGLRADFAGYRYTTRLPPADTGRHRRPPDSAVSYLHLSPKIGATYTLSSASSVFAAYRQGFRAPSQGQLFQPNSAANSVALEPVKVDSYEGGVRGEIGGRVVYQLSLYDMTVRDDILTYVTALNTREATNAGRTRHRGVESSLALALASTLHLDASYSVASHRYVTWSPQAGVSFGGQLIEQAPRDIASGLLTWAPSVLKGGRASVEWSRTGRYAEDAANTHFYDGYDVISLSASAFVSRSGELFARVSNLTNRRYAEIAAYDPFQQDQFWPGQPRAVYGGVRYIW